MNLRQMEEKLTAPRIRLMCVHQLPKGDKLSLTGNVVTLPSGADRKMLKLPKTANENECIPNKLKRKLTYIHHVDFRTVRPKKVIF